MGLDSESHWRHSFSLRRDGHASDHQPRSTPQNQRQLAPVGPPLLEANTYYRVPYAFSQAVSRPEMFLFDSRNGAGYGNLIFGY
jgi:hypothetical protein